MNNKSKLLACVLTVNAVIAVACNYEKPPVFQASLSANPPLLLEGEKSKITVVGQNFPSGLTYQWRATDGVCRPQKTKSGETIYEAPTIDSPSNEEKVKLVAEFYLEGEKQGEQSVTLTVKRRGDSVETKPERVSPASANGVSRFVSGAPRIDITIPGRLDLQGGQFFGDTIEGRVAGVDPKDYRVILYTLAPDGNWFVQPYRDGENRFTEIDQNLRFTNTYHTGVKYAALLAHRSYEDPPPKSITLPLNRENVVAFTIVDGVQK
jgi:hypothetical protein